MDKHIKSIFSLENRGLVLFFAMFVSGGAVILFAWWFLLNKIITTWFPYDIQSKMIGGVIVDIVIVATIFSFFFLVIRFNRYINVGSLVDYSVPITDDTGQVVSNLTGKVYEKLKPSIKTVWRGIVSTNSFDKFVTSVRMDDDNRCTEFLIRDTKYKRYDHNIKFYLNGGKILPLMMLQVVNVPNGKNEGVDFVFLSPLQSYFQASARLCAFSSDSYKLIRSGELCWASTSWWGSYSRTTFVFVASNQRPFELIAGRERVYADSQLLSFGEIKLT